MKLTGLILAIAMIAGSAASADQFTDRVISEFRELGFQRIEVKNGPTQVKVEGVLGNREYKVVYDRATGRVLKQEEGLADAHDIGRDGVEVQQRDRDFVGDDRRRASRGDENDEDDDDRSGRRDGDDQDRDDRSDRGGGDDDDDDDDDDEDDDDDDDDDSSNDDD